MTMSAQDESKPGNSSYNTLQLHQSNEKRNVLVGLIKTGLLVSALVTNHSCVAFVSNAFKHTAIVDFSGRRTSRPSFKKSQLSPLYPESTVNERRNVHVTPVRQTRDEHIEHGQNDNNELNLDRDYIMSNLCSPAPQSYSILNDLVQSRADARTSQNYDLADKLQNDILDISPNLVKAGFAMQLADIPYKLGGGTHWSVIVDASAPDGESKDVLHMAHLALGIAASASRRNIPMDQTALGDVVDSALVSSLS